MKIVFKLATPPPPPPRDYRADEICAAEGLLMLSQSISPPSFSSPSNPSATTKSTPVATATPAAAVKKTQDCVKKTQDWSPLPPLSSNFPYVCDVCGDGFKSYQALGGHKTCHRPKPTTVTVAPPVSDNDRAHVCSICQERFSTGQALGGHMRKHFVGIIGGGGPSKRVKASSRVSPGRDSSGLAAIEDDDDRSQAIGTNNKLLDLDLNLPYTHNFLD